ncbi:hypothetical protein [Phenylobacterium sp.]|uniref:hypothetical protein n=1 Tax=Phenylobacterium sp. TaxID=1871053 RepID=UPI002FC60FD5
MTWHLVLLWALTIPFAAELYGAPGRDFGSGMAVSIVDGNALRSAERTARAQRGPRSETPAVNDILADEAVAPRQLSEVNLLYVPIEVSAAVEAGNDGDESSDDQRDATSSPRNEVAGESTDLAGGDPAAAGDLLNQIARCLPADLRPDLSLARLVIEIGDDGRLAAAPQMVLPPLLTSTADRASADRVVQAALQCGPYTSSPLRNVTISLVPNFSKQPAPVSPPLEVVGAS